MKKKEQAYTTITVECESDKKSEPAQPMTLNEADKEWLKKKCGRVRRDGLEIMVFCMFVVFLFKGCSFN